MTDILDIIFGDDEARVLRVVMQRIEALERAQLNSMKTGMIVDWSIATKSAKWSRDRETSIGTNFTRWWGLNDINSTNTYAEAGASPVWDGVLGGSGTDPKQGQIGGLNSEGSYSVQFFNGKYIQVPPVPMGVRDWSIEATFSPLSLPHSNSVVYSNGVIGTNGAAIRISDGAGASGSKLVIHIPGAAYYDTGVTLVNGNWYHVIAVSDSTDSTLKWYVGGFNPVTKAFSITSGSVAAGAAIVAATSGRIGSSFTGYIDNMLFYNGEIFGGTARLSAEDRIRNAVQPHAPKGWASCDGAAVARNEFGGLFQVYGTYHGAGDGTTTFNMPNIPGAIVKI